MSFFHAIQGDFCQNAFILKISLSSSRFRLGHRIDQGKRNSLWAALQQRLRKLILSGRSTTPEKGHVSFLRWQPHKTNIKAIDFRESPGDYGKGLLEVLGLEAIRFINFPFGFLFGAQYLLSRLDTVAAQ